MSTSDEQFVLLNKNAQDGVAVVTLNRPKSLNALCADIYYELAATLKALDADDEVRCIVLTGHGKAFAAGADIKEMQQLDYTQAYRKDLFEAWSTVRAIRKPIIAAVNGYALGGGCELAMLCDMIIASEKAKFGQPEVLLGTIPGMGGTQRLTRAVGKYKAMDWILTGDHFTAQQAELAGLVSRVVEHEKLQTEAYTCATKIASFSMPIIMAAKESVNKALESSLTDGLQFEKRAFHSTFATHDRLEGMTAFIEKREPRFKHK